jgi:hypothetical protein
VNFGGSGASFSVDSDTQITAVSPAHAAGTVDITVTTLGGTSAASAADEFTYTAPAGCSGDCIYVGDGAQLEGDAGTRTLQFPVTLSHPATATVTVQYAITGVSAQGGTKAGSGNDFKLKSGTVTFAPNVNTGLTAIAKTVSATVFTDTTLEPDETLVVTLSAPTGGFAIGRSTGTGTILNDDVASGVTLGIGDGSTTVQASGSQTLKLPVTLSAVAGGTVTVNYSVTPGSATYSMKATGGGDFGGKTSGTVTFLVGNTRKTISIPIWPHASVGSDKTFTITLSSPTGGVTLIRTTGTGTILRNS